MDSIGDFLTIIRNASFAGNSTCSAKWSKMREGIASILKREGYIRDFKVNKNEQGFNDLELLLKYIADGTPAVTSIVRASKPGKRLYCEYRKIPKVLGGLGMCLITTSKGILTDKEARLNKAGGELLCKIW